MQGGRMVPFAGGGLIDRPTLMPMANGNVGLAGEVGTEGLVPLRRLPNGDLGVQTGQSHGGGHVFNIHTPITVNNTGGGTVSPNTMAMMQKQVSQAVYTHVKAILVDEMRPGGAIYTNQYLNG
jgi:phage-related minor tail protein